MDVIYNWPIWPVVVGLAILIALANEIGYRLGCWQRTNETEETRSAANTIKASVFTLVALLLGFTFSMTSSRHELRTRMVLDEANAYGTCYLRSQLLSDPERTRIQNILRDAVRVRLTLFEESTDVRRYMTRSAELDRLMEQLWTVVSASVKREPQIALVSQIVPATNNVIDLNSTRYWATFNHMPAAIIALMAVCVMISSLLVGHSSGESGRRQLEMWTCLNLLFLLVFYIALDFDRPRRGLVRLDHTPLLQALDAMEETGP